MKPSLLLTQGITAAFGAPCESSVEMEYRARVYRPSFERASSEPGLDILTRGRLGYRSDEGDKPFDKRQDAIDTLRSLILSPIDHSVVDRDGRTQTTGYSVGIRPVDIRPHLDEVDDDSPHPVFTFNRIYQDNLSISPGLSASTLSELETDDDLSDDELRLHSHPFFRGPHHLQPTDTDYDGDGEDEGELSPTSADEGWLLYVDNALERLPAARKKDADDRKDSTRAQGSTDFTAEGGILPPYRRKQSLLSGLVSGMGSPRHDVDSDRDDREDLAAVRNCEGYVPGG